VTDLSLGWELIQPLIDAAVESEVVLNLAFFPSAFGDYGTFEKLREADLDVGVLMRAALKSIAQSHYDGFQKLDCEGNRYSSVLCSGGLVNKSEHLINYLQGFFMLPLIKSGQAEDALSGHVELIRQTFKIN
jgi:hypothetical protein